MARQDLGIVGYQDHTAETARDAEKTSRRRTSSAASTPVAYPSATLPALRLLAATTVEGT